jgi:predicted RNase H-like nuclease
MFMAGVDGCRAGWVCFKVEVASLTTSVAVVDSRTYWKIARAILLFSASTPHGALGHYVPWWPNDIWKQRHLIA